jgi:hypothetical protein
MIPSKLKIDEPYPHSLLGAELVRRLRSTNELLWKRWVELEAEEQGIGEIHNDILRFLVENVEQPTHRDFGNLTMAMRGIAYHQAKQE